MSLKYGGTSDLSVPFPMATMPLPLNDQTHPSSLLQGFKAVTMPMKRETSVSTEPSKRARRTFDLSAFRYQPTQQSTPYMTSCSKDHDAGECPLSAAQGSRDSPLDLRTRSNSVASSFASVQPMSMSSSPLFELSPSIAGASPDGINQLVGAATAENDKIMKNNNPAEAVQVASGKHSKPVPKSLPSLRRVSIGGGITVDRNTCGSISAGPSPRLPRRTRARSPVYKTPNQGDGLIGETASEYEEQGARNNPKRRQNLNKSLIVQLKLHSAFLARYPRGETRITRYPTGDWVKGPSHLAGTQVPWVDLIHKVFADSDSGVMTHKEVWRAMEDRFSTEMLSRNMKSRNWKKSVHSALHGAKDFRTTEQPLTGSWKWTVIPGALVQKNTEKGAVSGTDDRDKQSNLQSDMLQVRGALFEVREPDSVQIDDANDADEESSDTLDHTTYSTAPMPPFDSEPDLQALIIGLLRASPTGGLRANQIYRAIQRRYALPTSSDISQTWQMHMKAILEKDPSFHQSRAKGGSVGWHIRWTLASQHTTTPTKPDVEDRHPVIVNLDSEILATKNEPSRPGPFYRTLIIEALQGSQKRLLTSRDICRAIQTRHSIDKFGVQAGHWRSSVSSILSSDPVFHKSRGTGRTMWGLEARPTTIETESEDHDVLPAPTSADGKENTMAEHSRRKNPTWRALIIEALEASHDVPLTKDTICRTIEKWNSIEALGKRTKNWQDCVRINLNKDSAFYKIKGTGNTMYGLASQESAAPTGAMDGKDSPAPIYTDGKHRWAELAHDMEEAEFDSWVGSKASDNHVIEDSAGRWRLRETPKTSRLTRIRQQPTPSSRSEVQFTAIDNMRPDTHEILTPREKVLIPMAMQWLMRLGAEGGQGEEPATIFGQLTDETFLPELSRADALTTITAAANLLQAQILKLGEDGIMMPDED